MRAEELRVEAREEAAEGSREKPPDQSSSILSAKWEAQAAAGGAGLDSREAGVAQVVAGAR